MAICVGVPPTIVGVALGVPVAKVGVTSSVGAGVLVGPPGVLVGGGVNVGGGKGVAVPVAVAVGRGVVVLMGMGVRVAVDVAGGGKGVRVAVGIGVFVGTGVPVLVGMGVLVAIGVGVEAKVQVRVPPVKSFNGFPPVPLMLTLVIVAFPPGSALDERLPTTFKDTRYETLVVDPVQEYVLFPLGNVRLAKTLNGYDVAPL